MNPPETNYAKTVDGVHIAYQVLGEGPVDMVVTVGQISHVDMAWDMPEIASLIRRLSSFSRVIFFDSRGNGCSDRDLGTGSFEAGMDDVRAVMDAADSERALQFGFQDGGMMCALFAASFPERTSGLILMNSSPRGLWASDWPWGWSAEEWEENSAQIDAGWGTLAFTEEWLRWLSPNHAIDQATVTRFARFFRTAHSPGSMIASITSSETATYEPSCPPSRSRRSSCMRPKTPWSQSRRDGTSRSGSLAPRSSSYRSSITCWSGKPRTW